MVIATRPAQRTTVTLSVTHIEPISYEYTMGQMGPRQVRKLNGTTEVIDLTFRLNKKVNLPTITLQLHDSLQTTYVVTLHGQSKHYDAAFGYGGDLMANSDEIRIQRVIGSTADCFYPSKRARIA